MLKTSVLISNLPTGVDSSDLEDMFSVVGNVRSARVTLDPESGVSLGRGCVVMSTTEEAANCVLHFHLQPMQGQKLFACLGEPRK